MSSKSPETRYAGAAKASAEDSSGRENPPHPFALVEGLRNIGYSPATALADLVDNSITAKAKNIFILVAPPKAQDGGYVSVEDDGRGMDGIKLEEAMRWGGQGPGQKRSVGDLGRFGLGMKTASISMGLCFTVGTRGRSGDELIVRRWDLEHVAKAGWRMQDGPDQAAEKILRASALVSDRSRTGTIVIVTRLDRLTVKSMLTAHIDRNEAALTRRIASHLGMVFHRFISAGVTIKLGASALPAWDPFEGSSQTGSETIGDGVTVTSHVLAHFSRVDSENDRRMAGPLGWNAHQGFFVYRAKRLIVPGGWLRLFSPEDHCRLARIRIDLTNANDAGWSLDVMKSSVVPPSWLRADLQRVGEATRRQAMAVFGFRGNRQAPPISGSDDPSASYFWNQVPGPESVRFRINRAHPVVQTLKQSVSDPRVAEEFLRAFERMLPVEAILQNPKLTTNGAATARSGEEIGELAEFARKAIKTLEIQGHGAELAEKIVLGVEPFSLHAEEIRLLISKS